MLDIACYRDEFTLAGLLYIVGQVKGKVRRGLTPYALMAHSHEAVYAFELCQSLYQPVGMFW